MLSAPTQAAVGTGNLFFEHLPAEAREHLGRFMTAVRTKSYEVVYEAGGQIHRVLFPCGAVVSVLTDMLDGSSIEVGLVGREGMTGLMLALGLRAVPQRAIVQIPNGAFSMSASDFTESLERHPEIQRHALRYAQATIANTSQFAACNRLHPVIERLARWLLMAHDRVENDRISLTQEFLGQMLGVRRSGVTVAALTLQRAGFIEYAQGRITIQNRGGLENAVCECYLAANRQFESAMGYSVRKLAPPARGLV